MKTLLVTGGSGFLGSYLLKSAASFYQCYTTVFSYRGKLSHCRDQFILDNRNQNAIEKILDDLSPEIVIHTASLGSVDYVEFQRKEGYEVNFLGTQYMVDACRDRKIRFIYVSSNAVYDGVHSPFSECSTRNPVNYYGQLKLDCENYIEKNLEDFLIIRPILMYGWKEDFQRDNPLTWQLKKHQKGETLKIVDDVFCNPLLVDDCADIILRLIQNEKTGSYNIGGPEVLSRYEIAVKIAEIFYKAGEILPVPSGYFQHIAVRPKQMCLGIQKIQNELGFSPLSMLEGLMKLKENAQLPNSLEKVSLI